MSKVERVMRLEVSAAKAWDLLRDFNGLPKWLPIIETSELREEGGAPIRKLTLPDGVVVEEKLENLDDAGMSCTYSIVQSPLPVADYLSTIRVAADGDAACNVHWVGEFEPSGAPEAEAVGFIEGVYDAGLGGLKKALAG